MNIIDNQTIIHFKDNVNFWLVRANGGRYYNDFKENNFISVSNNEVKWSEIKKLINPSLFSNGVAMSRENLQKFIANVYPEKNNRELGHLVTRNMNFLFNMNIGDLVLVPSANSKKFLIGVITSVPIELCESDLFKWKNNEYSNSPDTKRRKVIWLKEIFGKNLPKELHWIFSAHQAIFNLQKYIDHLLRLVTPLYIYKNSVNLNLKVATENDITMEQWLNFYSINLSVCKYFEAKNNIKEKVEITTKTNVQSPGFSELMTFFTEHAPEIMTALAVLFGDIDGKVKIKGVFPYIANRKRNEAEVNKINAEASKINAEEKKALAEAKKIELENEQTILNQQSLQELKEQIAKDAEKLKEELKIELLDYSKTPDNHD